MNWKASHAEKIYNIDDLLDEPNLVVEEIVCPQLTPVDEFTDVRDF
jgi:hypothetical protein